MEFQGRPQFGQTGSSQSQLLGFYCHFDSIFQFYTGDVNNITAVCQQYVKMWKIKVREMYRLKCIGNLTVGNSSVPQGMAWQHTLFEDTTLIFHVSISSFIPFFFYFFVCFISLHSSNRKYAINRVIYRTYTIG